MANKKSGTILNYTTEVSAMKTVGEIQQLLAAKGALSVSIDYGEFGEATAITFKLMVAGRPLWFKLPADPDAAFVAMKAAPDIPDRFKKPDQAKRVCWRILKDWVEAQLAIVQLRQATLDRAFFQYALDEGTGLTVYEHWLENQKRLTAAPDRHELRAVNE